MTAGEALDVIGRWIVQLFHRTKTCRFLLLPLECGSATIAPASPATFGNWVEQHVQSIRNKEKVKTDSDWSESKEKQTVEIRRLLKN